jgi:uncharacterized protein
MSTTSELFDAIKAGNLAAVRSLLQAEPALGQARHESGVSAVLLAAYYRRGDVVEVLLAEGAVLDMFDAAALGRLDRVKELGQADSERVTAFSADGFTPLGLAVFFGHKEVVQWLLAHGAHANAASENAMRVRPLHSAVGNGKAEVAHAIAEMLVAHGAEVNVVQAGGWTPLHQAAASGNTGLASLLLAHGADVNAQSEDGKTPVQMANAQKHADMVKLLAQHGAEAD